MEEISAKRKVLRSRWPRRSARRLRSRAQERSIASDVHPRRSCCKKAEHRKGLIVAMQFKPFGSTESGQLSIYELQTVVLSVLLEV